jgi:hypothetical protein
MAADRHAWFCVLRWLCIGGQLRHRPLRPREKKIRDKIKLLHSTIHLPVISTVHAIDD